MKKVSIMMFMICLIAASAFAFDMTADNISETDGFVVEVNGTDVTVKNSLGTDAFKVYVLIYTEDFLKLSYDHDELSNIYAIPILPNGFEVTLNGYLSENTSGLNDYKAKVYYVKEYN